MLKPSVEVRDEQGILVAEFWDCLRLDPAPVQELRRHYEARLRAKGRPELVVDLNGVGFAGSAALGGFVAIHRLAKQHSSRLIFCNVDPTVLEVLRVSKLENLFAIVADKPAALALALHPGDPPVADASGVGTGSGSDSATAAAKNNKDGQARPAPAKPADRPPLRRRNRHE
jgi:anti-anti-sigma factor